MMMSPRFEQALTYAAVLHSGQMRKGTGIPYIAHLLAVASIALEHGATEDEAIAALLHDSVEDAGGRSRAADVRARFGDAVADIVEGCTDADTHPKPPWEERKKKYIEHVREATPSVLLVSAADKLHNARSTLADVRQLGDALFDRFNGKKAGTLWYYREMVKAFEARGRSALTDELRRTVRELHQLSGGGEF